MRKVGNILLDIESLIAELVAQGLQKGDILALISVHLDVHHPESIEEYIEGGTPVFYYGVSKND